MILERIEVMAKEFALNMRDEVEPNPLDKIGEQLASLSKPVPNVGQIWRVEGLETVDRAQWVLLTKVNKLLRGILVLPEIWLATTDDIIIPATTNNIPMILATWSDMPISRECLAGMITQVDSQHMQTVLMMLQHRLTGGFRLRTIASRVVDGIPHLTWQITDKKTGQTADFDTGSRALMGSGRQFAQESLRSHSSWITTQALDNEVWAKDEQLWWEKLAAKIKTSFDKIKTTAEDLVAPIPDLSPEMVRNIQGNAEEAIEIIEQTILLEGITLEICVEVREEFFSMELAAIEGNDEDTEIRLEIEHSEIQLHLEAEDDASITIMNIELEEGKALILRIIINANTYTIELE